MTANEMKMLLENPKAQAFARGEKMQWHELQRNGKREWCDSNEFSASNFLYADNRIRIAPKPVKAEAWVVVHQTGERYLFLNEDSAKYAAKGSPGSIIVHCAGEAVPE